MISRIKNKLGQDGMGARASRGVLFTILDFGGSSGLRLLSNLILTRMLFPEAFGLMALIQVVVAGATMFSDLGLREAIIQDKRGEEQAFLDTAWSFQIIRGLILGVAIYLLASPMANFFNAPQLTQMLHYSALVPVLQGFDSLGMMTANRQLRLGHLSWLAIASQLIAAIVMIVLAYYLQSVWALIYGTLVGAFAHTILSHRWLPLKVCWFTFEADATKRLFSYGKYIFLATIAGFFVNQGDKLVLGKFITLEELAIYNIAFFLATVPLLLAFAINNKVMFPLYTHKNPLESAQNKAAIDRARFAFTGTLMAGITILAIIGNGLIQVLYDLRYHVAGPILVLIALATMPRLLMLSYEKVPLAFGNSKSFALFKISTAIVQFVLTILLVKQIGVPGAIIAPTATAIIAYPFLRKMVLPYQAWSARHDLFFTAVIAVVFAATWWLHGDIIRGLF
jgi:O-antigen/teichoic acid export membrane protein